MIDSKTYVKSDLIHSIQSKYDKLPSREIERIIDIIFKHLTNSLASGSSIELRNFGCWRIKNMKPKIARNPKTGEKITIGEKKKIYWKSSKVLNQRINKSKIET